MISESSEFDIGPDVLASKYQRDCSGRWKVSKTLRREKAVKKSKQHPKKRRISEKKVTIDLADGGHVTIYPRLLEPEKIKEVKDELMNCNLFRQYRIQGFNKEPKTHFLLHENANDNFDDIQPSYRYASNITMKSRPLKKLPVLNQVSSELAMVCGVKKWKIGVNPILYRDGRDHIGHHCDDDQNETLILALVVDSPPIPRKVVVHPISKETNERFELFLRPGDAYSMDGEMQENYTHSIPKYEVKNAEIGINQRRLSVVFRVGDIKWHKKDSGCECIDLSPRDIMQHRYGVLDNLKLGSHYSRQDLVDMGFHLGQQRGISGNEDFGCDAIILSGHWPGKDCRDEVLYTATTNVGAKAILKTEEINQSIRFFRSSMYFDCLEIKNGDLKKQQKKYRFDGMYRVVGSKKRVNTTLQGKSTEFFVFHLVLTTCTRAVYQLSVDDELNYF